MPHQSRPHRQHPLRQLCQGQLLLQLELLLLDLLLLLLDEHELRAADLHLHLLPRVREAHYSSCQVKPLCKE